jgi:hypothetical protein
MARPSPPRYSQVNRPRRGPRRRPPTYDPLAALSPQALQNIANRTVEDQLAPVRQELERLRNESRSYFASRSRDIQGFGEAGARLVAPIAGQIQGAYKGAAGETASFAKGYADAQTQVSAARAQGAEGVLAASGPTEGAPAAQGAAVAQAAGAGPGAGGGVGQDLHDVIYAEGEIPAAGLEREGAAFGAAAAFLPGAMLGKAMLEVGRNETEARKAEQDFLGQLSELEAKRPGLIEGVLNDLRNNELQKAATRINRAYLGIKQQQIKLDAAAKANQLGLDASVVDEQLSASNGYLTNKYGQPILNNGARVPYQKYVAPPKPPKPGTGPQAKRAKAVQTAREKMFTDAAGWTVKTTDKFGQPVTRPKYTYQQARNILWNKYGQALMGYASAGGKAALRKQINQMINQALAQIGLKPPRKPKKQDKSGYYQGPH